MKLARRVHKLSDSFPPETLAAMAAGFEAGHTYATIGRDLRSLGVIISDRTVARLCLEQRRRAMLATTGPDDIAGAVAELARVLERFRLQLLSLLPKIPQQGEEGGHK